MKCPDDDLKAVLVAAYQVLGSKPNMHVPAEYIRKKLKDEDVKALFPKCLDQLVKKGYVQKHPTGGNMTYTLTECGNRIAQTLISEGDIKIDWKTRCEQNLS